MRISHCRRCRLMLADQPALTPASAAGRSLRRSAGTGGRRRLQSAATSQATGVYKEAAAGGKEEQHTKDTASRKRTKTEEMSGLPRRVQDEK